MQFDFINVYNCRFLKRVGTMFSNGLPCNLPFPSCLGISKDSGNDELLPSNTGNREPVILNVYDMVCYSVYIRKFTN